jgi:hypothetical protein
MLERIVLPKPGFAAKYQHQTLTGDGSSLWAHTFDGENASRLFTMQRRGALFAAAQRIHPGGPPFLIPVV